MVQSCWQSRRPVHGRNLVERKIVVAGRWKGVYRKVSKWPGSFRAREHEFVCMAMKGGGWEGYRLSVCLLVCLYLGLGLGLGGYFLVRGYR